MSFWLEIHCDAYLNGCRSHLNENPSSSGRSTVEGLAQARRSAEAAARKSGWVRTQKGLWVCSSCQKEGVA